MRVRIASLLVLALVTTWLTGAVTRLQDPPPPSALARHPFVGRLLVDAAELEREALDVAGVPPPCALAELLTLVEAWRAGEGLARCGHPEEHELAGTRCSRTPGGPLDGLYQQVLERWWRRGLLDAGALTLLYGSLPPFLADTHRIEGTRLVPTLIDLPTEAIRRERRRLIEDGLSGAALWSTETVAGLLAERVSRGVDLAKLGARLNPEGRDLRREFMEGVIRPLALHQGLTGPGGEPLRAFVQRFGPGGTESLGEALHGLPLAIGADEPLGPLLAPGDDPAELGEPVESTVVAVGHTPPVEPEPPPPPPPVDSPDLAAPGPAPDLQVREGGFAVGFGGARFR